MPSDKNEEEGRDSMQTAPAPTAEEEDLVQLTGRVPKSLRRRVKMAAAALDMSAQDIQRRAIEEYLERHGL
ncbi:hypothetical protein [Nocardiopsis baichengensis]|uniref:hypothetical protein n=1 Tax=Nocardiopsis baichengensis TaxID=280240 RepID=UPI0003460B5F|nr:hypothetical protein [Nocardiopsis baichengensis]